MARIMTDTPTY